MFQGPKGYIAQICEVHLQETVQQNGRFTLFSSFHSNIYSILFGYGTLFQNFQGIKDTKV